MLGCWFPRCAPLSGIIESLPFKGRGLLCVNHISMKGLEKKIHSGVVQSYTASLSSWDTDSPLGTLDVLSKVTLKAHRWYSECSIRGRPCNILFKKLH